MFRLATPVLTLFLLIAPASAGTLTACFTPGQDCTDLIIHEIDSARSQLLVQAYEFTSLAIEQAIGRAYARGIDVRVILDKSNEKKKFSAASALTLRGLHMLVDTVPGIAHNKVMVIDHRTVITGSFNFTKAAQDRNAENVLIIHNDSAIAGAYTANWQRRARQSRPFSLRR